MQEEVRVFQQQATAATESLNLLKTESQQRMALELAQVITILRTVLGVVIAYRARVKHVHLSRSPIVSLNAAQRFWWAMASGNLSGRASPAKRHRGDLN